MSGYWHNVIGDVGKGRVRKRREKASKDEVGRWGTDEDVSRV